MDEKQYYCYDCQYPNQINHVFTGLRVMLKHEAETGHVEWREISMVEEK